MPVETRATGDEAAHPSTSSGRAEYPTNFAHSSPVARWAPPLAIVVFRLGSRLCALDASCVTRICARPALTPLFGLPPHLGGVANLGGRTLPVADLGLMAGFETRAGGAGIVARWNGREALFLVDEVLEVAEVDLSDLAPGAGRFIRGETRSEPAVAVIRTEELFADDLWRPRGVEDAA